MQIVKYLACVFLLAFTQNSFAVDWKVAYAPKKGGTTISVAVDTIKTYPGMVTSYISWKIPNLGIEQFGFISYTCGNGAIWFHNFSDTAEIPFDKSKPIEPWQDLTQPIKEGIAKIVSGSCKNTPSKDDIELALAIGESSIYTFIPSEVRVKPGFISTLVYSYPLKTSTRIGTDGVERKSYEIEPLKELKIYKQTYDCFEGTITLSQITTIKDDKVLRSNAYQKPPFAPIPNSLGGKSLNYLCGLTTY